MDLLCLSIEEVASQFNISNISEQKKNPLFYANLEAIDIPFIFLNEI